MATAYSGQLPPTSVTLYDYILTASMRESRRRGKLNTTPFGEWVLCPPDTQSRAYGPTKPMESFVVIPSEEETTQTDHDVTSENMETSANIDVKNVAPSSGLTTELHDSVDEFELVDFDSCQPQAYSCSMQQRESNEDLHVAAADVAKQHSNLQTELTAASSVHNIPGCDPFSDLEIVSAEDINSSIS